MKRLFDADKKLYSYAKNLAKGINNKIDYLGENAVLGLYELAKKSTDSEEKDFYSRNKRLIKWSFGIGLAATPVIYAVAGYAGGNPGLGYSIWRVNEIGPPAYSLIANPLLHPDLILKKGYEIFGGNPAQYEMMVKDSAANHLIYYFGSSSLISFLTGKGIGKLRNRRSVR